MVMGSAPPKTPGEVRAMSDRMNVLNRIVTPIATKWAGLKSFYEDKASGPVGGIVRVIRGTSRFYRNSVWNRFAKNREGKTTGKRATATLAGTVMVLWMIPAAVTAVWQSALMMTTWKEEVIFLTQAEEIDAAEGIHSVRGCRAMPCGDSDAVYFRVRDTFLHDVYSYKNRGHSFRPEEVAGVIPPGVSKCTTSSYGIRSRMFRIFPDLMDATCTPYNEAVGATAPSAAF